MKAKCHYCGKSFEMGRGHYNRAMKMGLNVYCSRKHSGLGRRTDETEEEKKIVKAWYDAFIREADKDKLKKKRHEYFVKDYAANPEKYKAIRVARREQHNEYCRRPEYRKKKKVYDQQHRAKKIYGQLWESAIALNELANIVDNRRAKQEQNIINKSQKRKRNASKNIKREKLESCTVGLYQPS